METKQVVHTNDLKLVPVILDRVYSSGLCHLSPSERIIHVAYLCPLFRGKINSRFSFIVT